MAILDAILNISERSMMPEWHKLDSSSTMPQQQESTKKKNTLKSSSRSFWFSIGLKINLVVYHLIKKNQRFSHHRLVSEFRISLFWNSGSVQYQLF